MFNLQENYTVQKTQVARLPHEQRGGRPVSVECVQEAQETGHALPALNRAYILVRARDLFFCFRRSSIPRLYVGIAANLYHCFWP